MQVVILQLSSTKKQLQGTYNQVDILKQEIYEAKAAQDGLRVELVTVKKEAQSSQTWLEALRNSSKEFQEFL